MLSNARGTPKRLPAASADSRRLVDSAVISKSSGKRLQRRDVRLRRPAAIRIRADDADTNPLGATVAHAVISSPFVGARLSLAQSEKPMNPAG